MLRCFVYCVAFVGLMLTLTANLAAQTVQFNYNGRIRVQDQPFTGTGLFKFALVSENGGDTYWSNDGTLTPVTEPNDAVELPVQDGFFTVNIGDFNLPNMDPLDGSALRKNEKVFLRVWFNDGVNGFQQLSPDRRITNQHLLSLTNVAPYTLYVNPVTGNDQYLGYTPTEPKKTIQAAWDALPSVVLSTTTIQLAAGGYFESPTLAGKLASNHAMIVLRGDPINSDTVRISGAANIATSNTAFRDFAMLIDAQQRIKLEGLQFEKGKECGLWIQFSSNVKVSKCRFIGSLLGCVATGNTVANLYDCYFADGTTFHERSISFVAENASNAILTRCHLISGDRYGIGVHASNSSLVGLRSTTVEGYDQGVYAKASSALTFAYLNNYVRNCNIGTWANLCSTVRAGAGFGQTGVLYTNCVTPTLAENFSVFGN